MTFSLYSLPIAYYHFYCLVAPTIGMVDRLVYRPLYSILDSAETHYYFLPQKVLVAVMLVFLQSFSNRTLHLLANITIFLQMAADLHCKAKHRHVNYFQLLVHNHFISVKTACRTKGVCRKIQGWIRPQFQQLRKKLKNNKKEKDLEEGRTFTHQ